MKNKKNYKGAQKGLSKSNISNVNFTKVESDNQCFTYEQGHFSIVVESPRLPPEPPEERTPNSRKNMPKLCTLVAIAGGGTALLVLLALLILYRSRFRDSKHKQKGSLHSQATQTLLDFRYSFSTRYSK
ncbi:hypothetical protein L1887_23209 [Cichorium endivia]|nr:hypothetical protein L1887_23209 [Cichorium endivia]